VSAPGLEFHQLPIVDLGVPDHDAALPLLDVFVNRLNSGRHIAVHCRAGIGRSSLIAAALLVRTGKTAHQAWHIITQDRSVAVPETEHQRRWLRKRMRLNRAIDGCETPYRLSRTPAGSAAVSR
jgi:protein-tyrosine phosphatase